MRNETFIFTGPKEFFLHEIAYFVIINPRRVFTDKTGENVIVYFCQQN